MQIFGIQLQRPSFARLTFAGILATVLFLLVLGSPFRPDDTARAGSLLVALMYGAISASAGLRAFSSLRHFAVQVSGCIIALMVYTVLYALVAHLAR